MESSREYLTKSGRPIDITKGESILDRRGWRVIKFNATVDGKKAGYLNVSYIPEAYFSIHYPTILHYLGTIEGRHYVDDLSTPQGVRAAMPRVLGFSEGQEAPDLTDRKLKNLVLKRYGESYQKFQDYHRDKPQVDFVHVDPENNLQGDPGWRRQGVGSALYEFVARWLSAEGLALWSSSTQTQEAKATWASLLDRGYPVQRLDGRLYLKY